MAEKRVIEYEAASELANDDWLLIDGVTEGTRKARPSTVTAELGAQVTNIATAVGGLTQVAMGHEQSFAPSYDESTSYDVGDLVMQYHGLYKCIAATTGTWDAGKWARTEVSEQLEESGKIDDVQVNGVSVVTDKVAGIDLTDMQADIDSKQADTKIGGASILDNNKVANLDFLASYGEASGSIASFNDGAAMPLKSLKVGIEAVQSGTGDPSPTNVRPISGWSAVNVYDGHTTDPLDATTYTTQLKDGQGNPLTCYGGQLVNENGVQTLDNAKVIVDMGDLNWTYQALSGDRNGFTASISDLKEATSGSDLLPAISSCYKPVRYNDTWSNGVMSYFYPTGKTIIVINNDYTDATAFKTAMTGQKIVYELATPQQIPQDNLPIASQSGTNNLWADSGEIMECKYVRDNSAVINDLIARVTALENA